MSVLEDKVPGRWAVVLAGGEGERLRPFLRDELGCDRPKQYCKLTGKNTLLEETLLRARGLVTDENVVTVIGPSHRRYLNGEAKLCRVFLEQPSNRETAPGVFLPAAHVLRADPSATLLILPSDHFIAPSDAFRRQFDKAAMLAERWTDRIVLLGAVPDEPETDYGWIEPEWAGTTASGAMRVLNFHEKPDARKAVEYFEKGCLWNTMIMAVKARTLWEMGWTYLPEMMERFEKLLPALGTHRETRVLNSIYRGMERLNFSRDILQRAPWRVMVLPMAGVEWNDLGRPERIDRTLLQLGRSTLGVPPRFPIPAVAMAAA